MQVKEATPNGKYFISYGKILADSQDTILDQIFQVIEAHSKVLQKKVLIAILLLLGAEANYITPNWSKEREGAIHNLTQISNQNADSQFCDYGFNSNN